MTHISKFISTLILVVVTLPLFAADDPILARQELMEGARDGVKVIGGMLKGETAFDAAAVTEGLKAIQKAAHEAGGLFPEGSESGHDTEAKATIWAEPEEFDKRFKEFGETVDVAIASDPQDLESLNVSMKPVFKECKSCHQKFRIEKD
jgi:cytochrome c556